MELARRIATRYLLILAQQEQQEQQSTEPTEAPSYGGKGPFELPADHVAAIQVPKGGACCAKCKFVDVANHACLEPNYGNWNGGDSALPELPLDEICSDWFVAGAPEAAPAPEQGEEQT